MSTLYPLRKRFAQLRTDPFRELRRYKPRQEALLREEFASSPLAGERDTYDLCRIIGNDLPPRHHPEQTLRNLRFILEHEPAFERCEKHWIVNRIVDPAREAAVLRLLDQFRQPYQIIPFRLDEYAAIDLDYDCLPYPDYLDSAACRRLSEIDRLRLTLALNRLKTNYIMNVNGARNLALQEGRQRSKWVLPWDGNCYLTAHAWNDLTLAIESRPHLKYFAVPIARTEDNQCLLAPDCYLPPLDEPQLVFRADSREKFDPAFTYGRRDKTELLSRLRMPGPWLNVVNDPWDLPPNRVSPEAGEFGVAGWTARLASAEASPQGSTRRQKDRLSKLNRDRQHSILEMVAQLDRLLAGRGEMRR